MINVVFGIVFPLMFIVGAGYLYGSRVRPEMTITNRLVLDVFMPALIFHVMVQDGFHPFAYVNLMLGGALIIFGSGLVAYMLARVIGYQWRTFVPSAMFSNWANLGLPLYLLTLGQEAVNGGVMLVVIGNIISFSLGIYIYSGHSNVLQIFRTPILIAVMLGLLFNGFSWQLPQVVDQPIEMMGQIAIPLMLFSLGVRLTKVSFNDSSMGLVMAVLCPVVGVAIAWCVIQLLPLSELHANILMLFGVLPPAVLNFMLAEQFNREPEKVASMVMVGNLLSIITIPLLLFIILS